MENKISIVIIEDDEDLRSGYCFLINQSTGFSCTGYPSAEEALNDLENAHPGLVLMDVNLPGMNGIECTRIIKNAHPEIQIMMFTVYENNENVFRALEAGASGYILKQSSPAELMEAIRELHKGGAPMSSSIARMVVSSFSSKKVQKENQYNLTDREEQVLKLLAEGFRYKDIGDKLFISVSTVRSHIYNIYEKLHVSNRTEAVNKVNRN